MKPDRRLRHGSRTWAAVTIRTLDAISRTRALSEAESDRLYQAIRDERRFLALGLAIAGCEADKARAAP